MTLTHYFTVQYKGNFGFIKPFSAVRDNEVYSQQFLLPSTTQGIEIMMGLPEGSILRHRLSYAKMDMQTETTRSKNPVIKDKKINNKKVVNDGSKTFGELVEIEYNTGVLKRGILIEPVLTLAFANEQEAITATKFHICLCRNEDLIFPHSSKEIQKISIEEFELIKGYELLASSEDEGFFCGFNRFRNSEKMYGKLLSI